MTRISDLSAMKRSSSVQRCALAHRGHCYAASNLRPQEREIAQGPSNRRESECLSEQKKPDSSRHRYELQFRAPFKDQCAKQGIGPLVLREDHRR